MACIAKFKGKEYTHKTFGELVTAVKESLQGGRRGNIGRKLGISPTRVSSITTKGQEINKQKAIKNLNRIFGNDVSVEIYNTVKTVGTGYVHGYFNNACIYLWNSAEIGTEYHEAFHGVFNLYLNAKERSELYKEHTEKYGMPSSDSLTKLREQYPDLESEQIFELAVEEDLAEKFKEYALYQDKAGFLGKIAEFFKRIFNYTQALLKGRNTIESVFEATYTGKFANKKLIRENKGFLDNRLSLKEDQFGEKLSPETQHHIEVAIVSEALDQFDRLIEMKDERGESVKFGVRNILLNTRTAFREDLRKAESKLVNATSQEEIEDLEDKIYGYNAIISDSTWYSKFTPLGNMVTEGWDILILKKLKSYGYEINASTIEEIALAGSTKLEHDEQRHIDKLGRITENSSEENDTRRENEESEEKIADRIYGRAVFETSSFGTISKEFKIFFSRIPISNANNLFDRKEYYPIKAVYNSLMAEIAGALTLEEMISRIETQAEYKPMFAEVFAKIQSLDDNSKAAFFKNFRMTNKQFLVEITDIEFDEKTKQNKRVTKYVRANQNSYMKSKLNIWRWNSRRGSEPLYHQVNTTIEVNGKEFPTKEWQPNPIVKNHILNLIDNFVPKSFNSFGEANYEQNKKDTYDILNILGVDLSKKHFEEFLSKGYKVKGIVVEGVEVKKILKGQDLLEYIRSNKEFTGGFGIADIRERLNNNEDIYKTGTSALENYTKISQLFENLGGISFLGGEGKPIFPVNLPTVYEHMFEYLKRGLNPETSEFYKEVQNSPFGTVDYGSVYLYRLFKEGSDMLDKFEYEILDTINNKSDKEKITFDQLTSTDNLVHKLNLFLGDGKKNNYIKMVMRTFGGRSLQTIVKVPRLSMFGNKMDILRDYIIQDLASMVQAGKDLRPYSEDGTGGLPDNLLIENYHYDPKEMKKKGITDKRDPLVRGRAFQFRQLGFLSSKKIQDVLGKQINIEQMSMLDYSQPEMEKILKEYEVEIKEYIDNVVRDMFEFISSNKLIKEVNLGTENLTDQAKESKLRAILKDYVENDIVFQNEMTRFSGGDYGFFKDHEDYCKRMDLQATPGGKYYLQKTAGGFGLKENFENAFVEDIGYTEEELKDMFEGFDKLFGSTSVMAAKLKEQYRKTNGTDASGWCTMEFWRSQKQGAGEWGKIDGPYEKSWQHYNDLGNPNDPNYRKFGYYNGTKFIEPTVVPEKTYYDGMVTVGNKLARINIKHGVLPIMYHTSRINTRMKDLHDRMNVEGKYANRGLKAIDAINTRSTAKAAVFGVSSLEEDLANLNTFSLPSKYLLRPQVLPLDHKTPLWSSQVRKIIISGLKESSSYTLGNHKLNGKGIFELYNKVSQTMLEQSEKKLYDEVGFSQLQEATDILYNSEDLNEEDLKVKKEAFNKANLNFLQSIREIVKKATIDRELPENYSKILDIKLNELYQIHEYATPIYFPAYSKKIESIINALVKNNVLSQEMHGTSAVQIADLGGYVEDESGNLKMPLFKQNEDGTKTWIEPAEIIISFEQAEALGLEVGEIINQDLSELKGIAYRIPNAGKNMMMPFKIVRILPKGQQSAVIVPKGITSQMGSDFDIDKLYLMFPNTKTVNKTAKKIQTDYDKFFTVNDEKITFSAGQEEYLKTKMDRRTLENIIMDLSYSILTNPEHYGEMMSTIDSPTLKDEVEFLKKKKNTEADSHYRGLLVENATTPEDIANNKYYNYKLELIKSGKLDRNNPLSEIELRERNRVSGILVGISANNITGNAVMQYGDFQLVDPITIKVNGKIESVTKLGGTENLPYIGEEADIPTSVTLNENLNSAVDGVKEPLAFVLNDNSITSPVKTLLVLSKFGNKLPARFLNQPIILEYTKSQMKNPNADIFSLIMEIGKKYDSNFSLYPEDADKITPLEIEKLTKSVSDFMPKGKQEVKEQLDWLRNYFHYNTQGKKLSKLLKLLNADRVSDVSNSGSIQEFLDIIQDLRVEKTIKGVNDFIDNNRHPLQNSFLSAINKLKEFNSVLMPYNKSGILAIKTRLAEALGKTYLSADLHNLVNSQLFHYVMTLPGSPFAKTNSETYIQELFTGDNNIWQQTRKIKEKYANKLDFDAPLVFNNFLANLDIHPSNYNRNSVLNRVKFNNALDYDMNTKNEFIKYFEDLYTNDIPEISEYADNLVKAMIYSSGFSQSADTFIDYIPLKYWEEKGYMEHLKKSSKMFESGVGLEDFIEDFIQHNVGSEGVLKAMKMGEATSTISKPSTSKDIRNDETGFGIKYFKVFSKEENKPCLYKFSHTENVAVGKGSNAIYTRIPTKGIKYQLFEYGIDKSIVNENAVENQSRNLGWGTSAFSTQSKNWAKVVATENKINLTEEQVVKINSKFEKPLTKAQILDMFTKEEIINSLSC